ncbi:hypothetical protein R6Q57_010530 [Mikania cordata]
MSSVKEAKAAAEKFDGCEELEGRTLKVSYRPPLRKKSFVKKPRDNETIKDNTRNMVYIGNISRNVDNKTLET